MIRLTLLARRFSTCLATRKPANLDAELDKLAELTVGSNQTGTPKSKLDKYQLIETFKQYDPKVQTERVIVPGVNRPIPVNVELNYYSPLKHQVKYGDLKAEVVFKCFDTRNLEFFSDFALRAAYYLGIPATGAKPIPVRRERWTVIKAPFVHAKSKENFERRTYGRVIKLWDCTDEVVDIFLAYLKQNSVWGVGVKASLYVREPLSMGESMGKIEGEGDKVLSDLDSTLEVLSKDTENPVAGRVLELLKSPAFTRCMSEEERAKVEQTREASL
ncbi:DEKNAAC103936 [Brettanomyces naardenensis]|uniref:Small ribosomal subunit protein uS10m n=1 Tax=Brettanomyces naardenensis TaxID=13370 RepID=A0A448YPM3_BRENA|nr:DEKNAAC103936 [Brettanomyces naardenensis]